LIAFACFPSRFPSGPPVSRLPHLPPSESHASRLLFVLISWFCFSYLLLFDSFLSFVSFLPLALLLYLLLLLFFFYPRISSSSPAFRVPALLLANSILVSFCIQFSMCDSLRVREAGQLRIPCSINAYAFDTGWRL